MKSIKDFSNRRYQNKTNSILFHGRVFKLQEDCSKFDMFVNINDNEPKMPENGLGCFYEEGEKIGSIIFKKTYYFFNGNTCIVYNKSGYDRIIRVLVKVPDSRWEFHREMDQDKNYHLKIDTKNIDVYAWWDVDWMSCGKYNCASTSKDGSWWKVVYNDICGIYETVAQKSAYNFFEEEYKNIGQNNKTTIEVPVK